MSSILPKNELETSNFCPSLLGQKFFVRFLEELKKTKCPFEINWPLAKGLDYRMQYKTRDKKVGFSDYTEVFFVWGQPLNIRPYWPRQPQKASKKKKKIFSWDSSVSPIGAKNSFSFLHFFCRVPKG